MNTILGLDLGVASIGWSLIENNDDDGKIVKSGVRIFQSNEQRAEAAPGESKSSRKEFKPQLLSIHLQSNLPNTAESLGEALIVLFIIKGIEVRCFMRAASPGFV